MELRTFLENRGITLAQHFSRRILQTLAHELYSDAEDRKSAIQTASLMISHGRRVREELNSIAPKSSAQAQPQSSGPSPISSECIAHNVANRPKDSESKFEGDLGKCWSQYVNFFN